MKRSNLVLGVVIFVFLGAFCVAAQTSEFTFQGKLSESGAPVSTPRDMIFRLWDETNTVQIGPDIEVNNVQFNNGVFTVQLDFGSASFDGGDRWIETLISLPGVNDYTALAPRQKFTSAPYAIRALESDIAQTAATAVTATNAEQLGGIQAGQYVLTTDPRLTDLRHPLPGSGEYIQNQSGSPQTANFVLGGTGKATFFDASRYRIGGVDVLHTDGANLIVGPDSGGALSGGINNAFVGILAGTQNDTGNFNTFTGNYSGQNTTSGSDNSFYGGQSGRDNLTGNGNSFYGRFSGFINNSGSRNSFFGIYAGSTNTTGDNNSALGAYADVSSNTLSFATAIGSHSRVTDDDTIVLGKTAGTYNGTERPADTVLVPGSLTVSGTFGSEILSAVTQINIGSDRVLSVEGNQNVFVGVNAGEANTGQANTFVGRGAGRFNTSGNNNSFFGRGAGVVNTTGGSNSFFGNLAGTSNTTGNSNAFFGNISGASNSTASANSFFGSGSGSSNQSGSLNAFVGYNAGQSNETGTSNAFFGANTGSANMTGNWNTFIGGSSGLTNESGSNLTLLGYQADVTAASLQYATAIGANSVVIGSDMIVLGKSAGTYNGIGRPADTVLAHGPIDTSTQYNLKGARFIHTGAGGALGNTFVGLNSGQSMTSGSGNTFFGSSSGVNNNGFGNSFFGNGAGLASTGNFSSFFGAASGQNLTTGSSNSFFGHGSGFETTTGDYNTFVGASSGGQTTTGYWNTFLGGTAGTNNRTGTGNIMVGVGADFTMPENSGNYNIGVGYQTRIQSGLNNAVSIGTYSTVTQSNSLVLGGIVGYNGAPADTYVGIGTPAPREKLHVASGRVYIDNPGQGVILRSPGGLCFELRVTDAGAITTTPVNPCP